MPVGAPKKYMVTFFALSIRVVTVEAVREAIITDDCLILIAITASFTAPDGIFTEWGLLVSWLLLTFLSYSSLPEDCSSYSHWHSQESLLVEGFLH